MFDVLILTFILGLFVGSFLNASIYRLAVSEELLDPSDGHKGDSYAPLKGRSACPECGHQLSWADLIPLLSFVLLRGRCAYCKEPISWQYPIVEFCTGALFSSMAWYSGTNFMDVPLFELLYLWIIASVLIVIFVYDLRFYLIPNVVLYPAILLAFVWRVVESLPLLSDGLSAPIFLAVMAAFIASAFFFVIYAASGGRAMGFGDVKLAILMGLFLGWPDIIVALFMSFGLGALFGIALILSGKKEWRSAVPFGPFLITGTFFALFFGEGLIEWYLSLLLI